MASGGDRHPCRPAEGPPPPARHRLRPRRSGRTEGVGALDPVTAPARCAGPGRQTRAGTDPALRRPRSGSRPHHPQRGLRALLGPVRAGRKRARVAGGAVAQHRNRRVARIRLPQPGPRAADRVPDLGPGLPAAGVLRRIRGREPARGGRAPHEAAPDARRARARGDALQRAGSPTGRRARCLPAVRQRIQRRAEPAAGDRALGTRGGNGMTPFARIRIKWGSGAVSAALDDTPTARALVAALPLKSSASTWGDEVYFAVQVEARLEPGARQIVEPGTVCFWTEGGALALPFGRTPISDDTRPKLVSRCNVLGRIEDDASKLASVRAGDAITVTRE